MVNKRTLHIKPTTIKWYILKKHKTITHVIGTFCQTSDCYMLTTTSSWARHGLHMHMMWQPLLNL